MQHDTTRVIEGESSRSTFNTIKQYCMDNNWFCEYVFYDAITLSEL